MRRASKRHSARRCCRSPERHSAHLVVWSRQHTGGLPSCLLQSSTPTVLRSVPNPVPDAARMPGDVVLVSRNQTESPVLITAMNTPLAPPDGELNDNDLRPVEVRAARAAVQAGVAAASVERLPFDLSALE